jgi:hypothetical protein
LPPLFAAAAFTPCRHAAYFAMPCHYFALRRFTFHAIIFFDIAISLPLFRYFSPFCYAISFTLRLLSLSRHAADFRLFRFHFITPFRRR